MRAYSLVASLCAFASVVVGAIVPEKRATVCNGHAEFCDRSYGNITYVGAHDSFTYDNDTLNLASDQRVDIPTQLDFGVRLLQAQAHDNDGVIHFCHTSCILFDGGPVETYLATVKTWMDANPNEVITFIFTNPDALSLPDQWEPAFKSSGLEDMAYVPPHLPMAQSDWPTLGDMIDAGTRLVVFLDAGADGSDGGVVDFIMPEFDMVWESPYSVTNASFPCSVDRINGSLTTDQHMYMINHSLNINELGTGIIVSDPGDAATTNGIPSIIAHANGCAPLAGGRYPNFVLLDFVNVGDAYNAVDQLNGV